MAASGDEVPDNFCLPKQYDSVHLQYLGPTVRRKISLYLNLEGQFNEHAEMINNFLGLAELVGFSYLEISNFERQKSPTEQLLQDWTTMSDLQPTVGRLWECLKKLERFDVLTDTWHLIRRDCEKCLEIKSRLPSKPIQSSVVSATDDDLISERDNSTVHDVDEGHPVMYDAFVCYNPDGKADLDFVHKLITELEGKHGLKLFVPWRDDLAGGSHNTVCAQLIEHRCRRMVIVLSPQYLKSPACDFQTKFAQGLAPGSRGKRLIPVLIENCVIPELLRHITCCNYTKKEVLEWFWKRLVNSVKAPLEVQGSRSEESNQSLLRSVSLDTSGSYSDWSSSTSAFSSSSSSSSLTSSQPSSISHVPSSNLFRPVGPPSSSGNDYSSSPYVSQSSIPEYFEFNPSSPQSQRKANAYEKMSEVMRRTQPEQKTSEMRVSKAVVKSTKPEGKLPNDELYMKAKDVPPLPPPRPGSSKKVVSQDKKSPDSSGEYFC
ncbi:hypothetical protein DPMN_079618 [Dreissena polymorpha]|uniref:Uncharacterized protein n=2 Tax=Dreissena polymorpha TaxID=45954 RepID=A0A9D3YU33_DREPO|nr:hypothetical protein DPMN_079618 [Dreissena polymorpha]